MAHTLLLADDSVTIQRVIELTFADEDVRVVAVGDGQQAIERIEADPPDIILADVDMPKRDGYEVASYVKSRPNLAHIPVVLLTGAFEPIDQARATAVGSDDVLAKPFEPQMVINRVKQLLGRAVERGAPRSPQAARALPVALARPAAASSSDPSQNVLVRTMALEGPATAAHPALDAPLTGPDAAAEGTQPAVSLDEYFDQLDAAFAHLNPGHSPAQTEGTAGTPAIERDDLDWIPARAPLAAQATPEEWSLRDLTTQTPIDVAGVAGTPEPERARALLRVTQSPVGAPPRPSVPGIAGLSSFRPAVEAELPRLQVVNAPAPVPAAPPPPPPIADAFAALLAAEQGEPAPPMGTLTGLPVGAAGITEPAIEEIVARVLERLSDRVVRETVTEMVSRIAERVVREEIERIKGRAK